VGLGARFNGAELSGLPRENRAILMDRFMLFADGFVRRGMIRNTSVANGEAMTLRAADADEAADIAVLPVPLAFLCWFGNCFR
jgi:hypothetical protein